MSVRKTTVGAVPMGACLTGNHAKCNRYVYDARGKVSSECCCDCEPEVHGSEWVPPSGPSPLMLSILAKYKNGVYKPDLAV